MTNGNLYPIRFASTGRTGTVARPTSATGQIAWSVETGKVTSASLPAELLIWQGAPLVSTYDDLRLFDGSGKLLWRRPKQGGTPVAVASDGRLYFKNPSLFMDSVDLQNHQILKSAPFPGGMGSEVKVLGFWPRAEDWVAVTFDEPAGDDDESPSLTVVRNKYPTSYGDWLKIVVAQPTLAPLLVPAKSIVALLINNDVVRFDVDRETVLPPFELPLTTAVEWSVDGDEIYVVSGYDEQHTKVVLAVSGEGETLWQWQDKPESEPWAKLSPPIRFGHRVYVLTEGHVLAIESGHVAWAYDLRSEARAVRHGSALADGSVLVTAGRSLVHVSAKGGRLFSLDVGEDILSPPTIDGDGNIYVATATRLVKVQ